jgi:FtsZ-interacting cell division protein ZipA
MENLSGLLFPIGTLVLIVLVQISFWFPSEKKQQQTNDVPRHRSTTSTVNPKTEDRREIGESPKAREKRPSPGGAISKRITITAQDIPPENFQCVFIRDESSSSSSFESDESPENKSNETSNRNAPPPRIQKVEGKVRIWKCACELGFLPAGILKTFGNAEAIMRLGVGQCYHKK